MRLRWLFLGAASLVLLASCGGGGGGGGTESTLTPYTVSVTVTGLNGTVVLQNNGGNNLSVSANGSATFTATLIAGANYSVTVLNQPAGQNCAVGGNGSGQMPAANVSGIAVTCSLVAPVISTQPGVKQLRFSWSANPAATFYRVLENPDGSGYAQLGANFANTSYTLDLSGVLLPRRVNASYIVESCNSFGCTDSAPINLASQLINLIGYFKASNTGASDFFGTSLALSSDGSTLAIGARGESSALTGVTAGAVNEATAGNGASASGVVYVFTRSGTTWTQQAYVKASNTEAGDGFGTSVALSADGNTLAVGANGESSALTGVTAGTVSEGTTGNGASSAGAVYVLIRSAGTWTQQAYVKASNTGAGDFFGNSVALSTDGNTLAVGANREASAATGINPVPGQADNSAQRAGAAYVFVRSAGTWTQQAYIKASNSEAFDEFGFALALSGDGNTLAVGSFEEASALTGVTAGAINEATAGNAAVAAGAVYVFFRSSGVWSQQAYVKASNTQASDVFSASLALSGDGNTLAVGATAESSALTGVFAGSVNEATAQNGASQAGAVYVFFRSSGTWSQQAYVKASNAGTNLAFGDNFGASVALSADGNTLAAGSPNEASALTSVRAGAVDDTTAGNAAQTAGAIYVFTRSGASWSQQAYVKASNTGTGDNFGASVALSGDGGTLAVTARNEASNAVGINGDQTDNSFGSFSPGAVYLY